MSNEEDNCAGCKTSDSGICHVNLNFMTKIKDSTKKLLCLLEELQSKTHSKTVVPNESPIPSNISWAFTQNNDGKIKAQISVSDIIGAEAIKKLENQTKELDSIVIEDDDDDCSVYKRLTRKCQCLNQREYNDFVIHFNEDTKFCTTSIGEVIKNMRILKKFLYMGGPYMKNALMFLNEGLSEATYTEKVEIIQAMSFADVCNVFDEYTIVTVCISWPCKVESFAEPMTKELAAGLLYKLAQVEEGRRYLNLNSRIKCEIKKVLKKKSSKLDSDILDCLNTVLKLCEPSPFQQQTQTYCCRPLEEDLGNKTLNALTTFRQFMALDEVFQYLETLREMSNTNKGKMELTSYLPQMLNLFRNMLIEYDSSGMNIIITNILNNVVAKTAAEEEYITGPKTLRVAHTATEPILMKNVVIQIPIRKNPKKNQKIASRLTIAPNKVRQASKRKESQDLELIKRLVITVNEEWNDHVQHYNKSSVNIRELNRSQKFSKSKDRSVIVVPQDGKKNHN